MFAQSSYTATTQIVFLDKLDIRLVEYCVIVILFTETMVGLCQSQAQHHQVANFPISILCLTSQSANPLVQAGITTIGDLLAARSRGLEQVKWLGVKAISEIEEAINQLLEETGSMTDAELEIVDIQRTLLTGLDTKVILDLSKIRRDPDFRRGTFLNEAPSNPLYKAGVTTIKGLRQERSLHFSSTERSGTKAVSEIRKCTSHPY